MKGHIGFFGILMETQTEAEMETGIKERLIGFRVNE